MTHVDVNGVCFNVERAGAGPALVLLHGFTGSSTTWADHVPVFAREFDTVAVDLLGHGASAVPIDPERYRMEHAVADLTGLLDQMNISRAAWLGYSMGGRVALQYAVAQPARVAALVLEGASPGIADPAERASRVRERRSVGRFRRAGRVGSVRRPLGAPADFRFPGAAANRDAGYPAPATPGERPGRPGQLTPRARTGRSGTPP